MKTAAHLPSSFSKAAIDKNIYQFAYYFALLGDISHLTNGKSSYSLYKPCLLFNKHIYLCAKSHPICMEQNLQTGVRIARYVGIVFNFFSGRQLLKKV